MRTLLTPSMLNVIVDNLKKGNAEGRLFEMAPVYLAKELPISEHPHERQTLCIGAFGPEEDFFTVKGAHDGQVLADGVQDADGLAGGILCRDVQHIQLRVGVEAAAQDQAPAGCTGLL